MSLHLFTSTTTTLVVAVEVVVIVVVVIVVHYRGVDKYLARPGRKQTTATEDFEFHISYL